MPKPRLHPPSKSESKRKVKTLGVTVPTILEAEEWEADAKAAGYPSTSRYLYAMIRRGRGMDPVISTPDTTDRTELPAEIIAALMRDAEACAARLSTRLAENEGRLSTIMRLIDVPALSEQIAGLAEAVHQPTRRFNQLEASLTQIGDQLGTAINAICFVIDSTAENHQSIDKRLETLNLAISNLYVEYD